MTPQEQQLLQDLANRINQTVLPEKDPDAERFLIQSLSRNPDAVYILAQTVLVQQYALDQAKQQLTALQQKAQQAAAQPARSTSFLGGLLGSHDPAPPPPPAYGQPQYQPVANYAPPPPQYAQPVYAQPGYGTPSFGGGGIGGGIGGGGGFLRSAMQIAGGVAVGSLAVDGIESLMHGFGEHAGYGGGSGFGNFGGGMGGGQPREEVINNYYGGANPDIEDRRDDGVNDRADFADTSNDTSNDDYSQDDSSSDFDSSSSDDSN
jgi:hypothetical protein